MIYYKYTKKGVDNMNIIMNKAIESAINGIRYKEGNIIACGNNKVILNNDPTAHAEVIAIRNACQKLNTYDLSNCIMYTTCEPCPMCLGAIIWSNIKTVYYGCDKVDANNIGFRDDMIYEYLNNRELKLLDMHQINREECMKVFEEYTNNNGTIY